MEMNERRSSLQKKKNQLKSASYVLKIDRRQNSKRVLVVKDPCAGDVSLVHVDHRLTTKQRDYILDSSVENMYVLNVIVHASIAINTSVKTVHTTAVVSTR